MKLTGRAALVTGGNRGIGREVCRQLSAEGARILLGSRDWNKGTEAAAELQRAGADVKVVLIDVADEASIQAALHKLQEPVDILVNNAAIFDRGQTVFETSESEFETVIRTNLLGPVILARALAQKMKERHWGRIVNVSSGMGSLARGFGNDSAAYRLSKLALNGWTLALAASLRGSGVLVNSVDPGWVRTEMGGPRANRTPEEGARSVVWAALIPDNGPSGGFFRDGNPIPF